jgi:GAF domain-containing protein
MSLDPDAQAFVDGVTKGLKERLDLGIEEVMSKVSAYLHTEAISIFVMDRAAGELVLEYAAEPVGKSLIGLRIPIGQGVVGWVAKYSEDLIVPSTDLDPRFYSGVDEQTGFVTRSILCVPMVRDEEVVGAIEVMNKTTGNFNVDDVLLLQAVADLVVDYV